MVLYLNARDGPVLLDGVEISGVDDLGCRRQEEN